MSEEEKSQPRATSTSSALDISKLRLAPGSLTALGTSKVQMVVQFGKPNRDTFVMMRPGAEMPVLVLKTRVDGSDELYVVSPDVAAALDPPPSVYVLRQGQTRQGVDFIWPLRMPADGRKSDDWAVSALAAANVAEQQWIKVVANMHAGAYEAHVAKAALPPAAWPEKTFEQLVGEAVRDRVIDHENHPVLRKLRGEV